MDTTSFIVPRQQYVPASTQSFFTAADKAVWQILAALAPNFGTVVVARALGGLSSAGGSVTLGMVADLYDPNEQQYAVAFIVFSSVFGSVIGPLVGPFIQVNLNW